MRPCVIACVVLALASGAALPAAAAAAVGDNVVAISVSTVDVPRPLPGDCTVKGVVREVRDGRAFRTGAPIAIAVPCALHAAAPRRGQPPEGPRSLPRHVVEYDAEVLKRSRRGLARVDDAGQLIWESSTRSYGRYGHVSGYRVLDGVFLPIRPS